MDMAAPEARKTKMVRVKQAYIDSLLARYPKKPFPYISEELIQLLDPERQEKTRARQARMAAILKVIRDEEEDILEQYRTKGYAETEVEVREHDDDEADGEQQGQEEGQEAAAAGVERAGHCRL